MKEYNWYVINLEDHIIAIYESEIGIMLTKKEDFKEDNFFGAIQQINDGSWNCFGKDYVWLCNNIDKVEAMQIVEEEFIKKKYIN